MWQIALKGSGKGSELKLLRYGPGLSDIDLGRVDEVAAFGEMPRQALLRFGR